MNDQNVVVRFAPSPTGPLHIGGVRTALFNYLFAKRYGGKFLLRIEDTDQGRFVPGAEQYIREALAWCGIEPDESPWKGGPHAPYRQSERKPMYAQYAMQLLSSGNAYYAFDSSEELDAIRQKVEKEENGQFQYNAATRMKLKNSLTLSEEETKRRIAAGDNYVIRFKMPAKEEVKFHDLIRDEVTVFTFTLDDKVLLKSDGMPTYHLANVVDDHLMGITHVIRGEEWLPSAPLHVMMYRAFGWQDTMPKFCHLPLLLKPDGNGKLSKRDGDKMGFAVFPLEWKDPATGSISKGYREDGYLPDAFINFLALLGWNPGTEQEIFSLDELSNVFSMERVGKSGTKFDIEKAKWFNQQYLKKKDTVQLAVQVRVQLAQKGIVVSEGKALKIVQLLQDRATFSYELWDSTPYIYSRPTSYDESVAKKKWNQESASAFLAFAERLEATTAELDAEGVKTILNDVLTAQGVGLGKVMQALRVAVTGAGSGPDLMLMMEILGKAEVAQRIRIAVDELNKVSAKHS